MEIKTAKQALAAVQQWGYALEYVPENHKTVKLCLEAVKTSGPALQYVPEKLRAQIMKEAGISDDDKEET